MNSSTSKKIAIIGSGIAGLGAAYLLQPHHHIEMYEKNDYLGGHSRTVEVNTVDGKVAVDTGFIVFNKRNYPLLTRLFDHLQVPIAQSNMSFGVSIDDGWLEYGSQRLSHMFAQKRNVMKLAFWRMLADIVKFNRRARDYLNQDPRFTLGDCLDALNLGPWFRQYFLLAMGGAIWSTPLSQMLAFPACTFVRFFENHGLLTINDHPQWYTVKGGSREYVTRLIAPFKQHIHLNRAIKRIWRDSNGVIVEDQYGHQARYDDVILACHADQALAMIQDATAEEQSILGAFRYQLNRAVLHSDTRLMPKRRAAWASWVYLSDSKADHHSQVSLSYWMNNLQPLPSQQPLIVTLNPHREPDPSLIHDDYLFEHPVFDSEAIRQQSRLASLQGRHRLWFCGAYQRYGFHEDGLNSAVQLAKHMGIEPQW